MVGFDIGGTKCAVCVGHVEDDKLIITDKKSFLNEKNDTYTDTINKMCSLAESMTDDLSLIGISCGGPLDSKKGVIMSPPNLPGWDNVHIVDELRARYGGNVYIQNDANACAVAEWLYGAGKGYSNVVFLTFGTGLGAGLILDGKLYTGTNDMAGEVGHIRLDKFGPVGYGKMGSFEGFCSGGGIARLGEMMALESLQMGKSVSYCPTVADLGNITAKLIAERANAGYEDAVSVYRKCGEKLGFGLSVIIDILNPEAVIIGSVYQRCEHLLRDSAMDVIRAEALPHAAKVCKILPAQLSENIGDYAALSVAAMNI